LPPPVLVADFAVGEPSSKAKMQPTDPDTKSPAQLVLSSRKRAWHRRIEPGGN
jgi:hypothetical protein